MCVCCVLVDIGTIHLCVRVCTLRYVKMMGRQANRQVRRFACGSRPQRTLWNRRQTRANLPAPESGLRSCDVYGICALWDVGNGFHAAGLALKDIEVSDIGRGRGVAAQ